MFLLLPHTAFLAVENEGSITHSDQPVNQLVKIIYQKFIPSVRESWRGCDITPVEEAKYGRVIMHMKRTLKCELHWKTGIGHMG